MTARLEALQSSKGTAMAQQMTLLQLTSRSGATDIASDSRLSKAGLSSMLEAAGLWLLGQPYWPFYLAEMGSRFARGTPPICSKFQLNSVLP